MNHLPGTIPRDVAPSHPRRRPAHRSVSLRHSPPSKAGAKVVLDRGPTALSSPNLASDKANPPSVSPQRLSHKNSSGESSDAGRWFETTNNNALQSAASLNDNEPPFFLRNSSSSETPPEGTSAHLPCARSSMPYRPGMATMGTDGSSTEDFRSVIDDLTIANKKLRQKLKKYEKVHDAHLQEEKLFEVKFHGLPDHKKKELEETLRKFAAELDDGGATDYPLVSHVPVFEQQKTQSSTSRFAESGYASMSASGQNSSAVSNQPSNKAEDSRKMSRSAYNRQQQSIQSYLHDIPLGLLPQSNVSMTDKSKKKLVVRRLEQVFAGKQSTSGNHTQPMQQEEVAQSAATADREEREATGGQFRPEGLRVARIKPESRNEGISSDIYEALPGFRSHLHMSEKDFAESGSPDQRPTRPLDLDPFRAQVPGENMDYIRHLGFTPPNMDTGDAPEEGHGWLYLNLLINMAQLHTLNVTPEFVKDALTDYSGHLELSRDGRKVRWKGGFDITKNSSDSSSEHLSGNSSLENGSPSKRIKTEDSRGSDELRPDPEQWARRMARAKREREMNKFAYTPMFFRKAESEDEEDDYGIDAESYGASLQRTQYAANSSGFGNSAAQNGSSLKRSRDDGPMIFYTKAKFCTDLSGDRLGASLMPGAYKTVTSHPIGVIPQLSTATQRASGLTEPRGPLDATPKDTDSNNGSRGSASESYFGFSPAALRDESSGSASPADLIDFEASGLGGVQPDDNFAIHVRRSQVQVARSGSAGRRRSILRPNKIVHALAEASSPEAGTTSPASPPRVIKEEVLSVLRKKLPASALPPASFLPFDSTSSGDVDSDLESEASSEADSASEDGPATALQLLNVSPGHSLLDTDSDSESSQYSEDTDDGSVDLLATARQLDPKAVRTQEREYDAALADRLAEDIVAGSSAATAVGGSGFNTPAVPATQMQVGSSSKRASTTSSSMSSSVKLKRSRTTDSAGVKKQPKSQNTNC